MFLRNEGENYSESVEDSELLEPLAKPPSKGHKDRSSTLGSIMHRSKLLHSASGGEVSQSVDGTSQRMLSASQQRRLQQNRQSARRSRSKKKEQLEYMESRVEALEAELLASQNALKLARDNIDRHLSQHNLTNNINVGRKITYERLQQLTADDEPDEDEINLLLDTLKVLARRVQFRIGANGVDRQGTIDYYFKQMINIYFPAFHRYMTWTADNNIELFGGKHAESSWLEGIRVEAAKLSKQQLEEIKSLGKRFVELREALCNYITDLQQTKQSLDSASEKFERILEDCRKTLSSVQSAQLVIFIEKSKYKREMDLWRKDSLILKEDAELGDRPTKRTKLE